MKRTVSLVVIMSLAILLVSACSSSNNNNQANDVQPPASEKDSGKEAVVNEFGWTVPEKTIEINFYAGQDNPDKVEENQQLLQAYILEQFNVKLNKIVYDVDKKEKLNLMLASGDYPEVITGLSAEDVAKWAAQGKAIELSEYIEKQAPNIKSQLGDWYSSYFDKDGKLYGLPRYWGILPIPDYSAHIRYDWWTAMGSPAFETPEQYFDLLKQMQQQHATNSNGETTYALSSYAPVTKNMVPTLAGMYGLKDSFKVTDEGEFTHWVNTDEGLELTKYINRFYREGLLDPDMFVNKFENWKAKFSTERVMGHIGAWWQSWNGGHEVWQKTNPDWKEEQRYIQVALKADSADMAYLSAKNARSGSFTIITDKAKSPESIIKWLNFSVTDLGTRLIGWGAPNQADSVWTFKDGKAEWVDAARRQIVDATWNYDLGEKIGQDMFNLVEGQGLMKDDGKSTYWFDQNFNEEAKWKKLMNDNLKDTIYDFTRGIIPIDPSTPLAITMQQVDDQLETLWAKAVMSDTEEAAVSNFMALRDKLNKAGLKDIEQFKSDVYKQRMQDWK
ncbi:sugar ABC transporter substrate-binding protein [Paenibacillus sp. J5C_2022]|uniref:sugar ABC transporter substrate-binding protein n=1 Tax=Paenibacillus sp. J5C2022 TaxID=2977129 RepID=UPI0021D2DA75|nr:sugar ABC transporter substrate-binding protein [Paenibacillus sp. J5C2022]MCU6711220.1 sugar ABC transporter substrate-binding protein [Paenibacillus sp. J5C2022]